MIHIQLNKVGKHYNREWIFKNIDYTFTGNQRYVIIGGNGSGKSTLLQLIAANITPSEGTIVYSNNHLPSDTVNQITSDTIFRQLSFVSPYLELLEEYTLTESIRFQAKFKKFNPSLTEENIIELSCLKKTKNKILKYYSSGMKQRVRLALAIFSDTPLLLLDEPASNLDKEGIAWYREMIKYYTENRLIIVCSNQQQYEYDFCTQELLIDQYK